MTDGKRISIVIPFYNVEKYIYACLQSVFCQDIPEDEYEVICVNDGSTDGSRSVVEDFRKLHGNLKLIDHPCNLKLGTARNTGRRAASGAYIWNVDSDDMVAPDCLKGMLEVCEALNPDVLEFGYVNYLSGDRFEPAAESEIRRDGDVLTGPQYLERYYLDDIGSVCGIWRKVYKKSFLELNGIYSPPINMGEDEPFAVSVFALAERVAYFDRDCYYYRHSDTSLVGEDRQNWNPDKWYEAGFVCSKYLDETLNTVQNHYSPAVLSALRSIIKYGLSLWKIYGIPSRAKPAFWSLCRKNFFRYLFVFRYYGKKTAFRYLWNVLFTCPVHKNVVHNIVNFIPFSYLWRK